MFWLKTMFFALGKNLKNLPIAYIIEKLIEYTSKGIAWFTESILDNYVVDLCKAGKIIWDFRKEKSDIELIKEFNTAVNKVTEDYLQKYGE